MEDLIDKLYSTQNLTDEELLRFLREPQPEEKLFEAADSVRRAYYGDEVFLRGLIEFTNYCKNDCYYCGIRAGNSKAERYRLSEDEILSCCAEGYDLGYRTFVLQGGEDPYFTDERVCAMVARIHKNYPDCAITLSIGEKPRASYEAYFEAGARRYLLRHETADPEHYRKLHPERMSLENRKRCLRDLKEIGYQTGAGFMIGSPYQTPETLLADFRFLQSLRPEMIGVGPYLRHQQTPLSRFPNGDLHFGLKIVAMLRLMFPKALIPATTAFGTLHPQGRELALRAGANVVMPNLSPVRVRKLYELYENKICTGEESAQCRGCLSQRVKTAGYRLVTSVGNALPQ